MSLDKPHIIEPSRQLQNTSSSSTDSRHTDLPTSTRPVPRPSSSASAASSAPTSCPTLPPGPLARTSTNYSTTTTLYAPAASVPPRRATPSPAPPVPAPDVVSLFDPASAGGGGPLVRIATAHSQRSQAREKHRSNSGTSARPSFLSFTKAREEPPAADTHALSKEKSTVADDLPTDEEKCKAEEEETAPHVYPDGGYGWVIVVACTTMCALTNGWGTCFGVFQQFYSANTYASSPSSVIVLAGTTQGFFYSVTAFISGRLGDKLGFKRVLFTGAFVCWVGTFCAAFSSALWATILCQGVITGIGQGIAVPLFMSLPSQWFWKYRGLASGITMGGAGIGGGVGSLVVRALLTKVGLRYTLIIMSFVNLIGMVVAILFMRTRPTSPEAGKARGPMLNMAVVGHSEFWSVALSLLIGVMGYPGPFMFLSQYMSTTLPELAKDKLKMTSPITILAFAVVLGRGLVGFCSDHMGAMNTYILVFVLSGVVQCTVWVTAKSYGHICAFAAVYGLVAPGYMGLIPQIVVTLFGPAALASNTGILLLFNGPGNLISGPLGGAIFDASGSWKWPIIAMGTIQCVGGLIAVWARLKASTALFAKI